LSPTNSEVLSRLYARHNAKRDREFIYGGVERIDSMRRFIPKSAVRVLDVGCRDGALAAALGLSHREVIGVDIDEAALKDARSKGVLSPCAANLWYPLPFRTSSVDLVLAGEVLEHIVFPALLVREIGRILRPGGRAVGSVPNAFRLKNRLIFLAGRSYENDPTHLRQFSYPMLIHLLETELEAIEIHCVVGRFAPAWPRLFANDLVWKGDARRG
jgi:SAM-dependent methyltransferase